MSDYLLSTPAQTQAMLDAIGKTRESLFDPIPSALKLKRPLNLPKGLSEMEVLAKLSALAAKNKVYSVILRGAGAEHHYIPAVVKNFGSREEFVSAYTPYQAEFSQGILQSIFEYQSAICELTGMDGANASVYDGATAAAESIQMVVERNRKTVLIADTVNPQTIATIKTYTQYLDIDIRVVETRNGALDLSTLKPLLNETVAGVLVQHPNYFGILEDVGALSVDVHAAGAKLIVYGHPLAMTVLKSPRALGADIAVGEAQSLGLALSYGGPYLGYMATTSDLVRRLPGRIVGQTVDTDGKRAFVLTLQAREQHIRREKATSSLCSNQALCALTASVYVAVMGPQGLTEVAQHGLRRAHYFQQELTKIGFSLAYDQPFFHEFVTTSRFNAIDVEAVLDRHNILSGLPVGEHELLWCVTETTDKATLDRVIAILAEELA
jgi:glycine dehydrogenase subunit 1